MFKSILKSLGKLVLKVLGKAAVEAAPEAVKVVKDGLKKGSK